MISTFAESRPGRLPQPLSAHSNRLSPLLASIQRQVDGVEGWLSPRETAFLATVTAHPTTEGAILEIGSFRGRSTIALAMAERYARETFGIASPLIAVDPMLDDDVLMSHPAEPGSARRDFETNLVAAGVRDRVDFRQAFSYEVAPAWQLPLRMLWIDGDHSYASTKQDYELFHGHLADGAILVMHDVLSRYDGCIRVFCEDVLTSPHFGAAGLCGSIGWAQYGHQPTVSKREQSRKASLLNRLRPLLPYHLSPNAPRGLNKLRYKWLRSRVPHGAIRPQTWVAQVKRKAILPSPSRS